MFRRIARALPAILVVLLGWPAVAAAQEALDGCKSPIIANYTTPLREVIKAEGKPDVTHTLLKGNVEIVCDDTRLYADEIEWYSDSEWMYARGHVLLQQPQIRINADSARMNRRTHLGTFNAVEGSIRMHDQKPQSDQFGQMEPDALFDGKTLEKTGPHTYKLNDGEITTCTQPTPRWQMGLTDAIITPGEHVVMKNMVLRVKDVPVFYFPFMYYPINKEGRSTGFLMPSYGSSSVTGFHLSNAFFWAIDRSQDATFYHDYYKKAGQGFGGNYEYALDKGSRGDTTVSVVNQKTNTVDGFSAQTSYTIRGSANQALPDNFRLMGNVNYFSSVASQQIYQQNLAAFSSRSSQWSGAVSGGVGRYRVTGQVDQSDLYNGSAPAQRSGHLPLVNFTVPDAPIGHSRVYFGVQNEVIYRLDQTNVTDPTTDRNLWRTDILPTFRVPLSTLPYFNVTTTASWRFTSWSQSIDPADPTQSHAIGAPIYRQLFNVKTTIDGPVFSRVFQPKDFGYADKLKHVIDPQFTIDWWSPFNDYSQVVKQDGTDYLVGGTTNLTYGIAQHILAKRHGVDGAPGQSAEIVGINLQQTYSTNSLAVSNNPYYQSSSFNPGATTGVSNFSPVLLNVTATPAERVNGTFFLNYDTHFGGISTLGASGRLTEGTLQMTGGWSKSNVIDGNPNGFEQPVHSLNLSTTIKPPDHHVGGSYQFNWDIVHGNLVQQRLLVFYNSQCCGISFDYQTLGGGSGFKPDRRFGVSISLAGLGSFSNPFGSFGDNSSIR
jgi:LPS-assembly protein